MIPIVTPGAMEAIDAAAPASTDELIDRAARALARVAIEMLGGTYGRRVVILAGPGKNGADGRVAVGHLERQGVRCTVIDALDLPAALPRADLVIDAAFGTGLRRSFDAPSVETGVPVLAVDMPSGVNGLTGELLGRPIRADRTVTFGALKPGLVIEPGRSLAGAVTVAPIGLEVEPADAHVVQDADVALILPVRSASDHKWRSGVRVVGGSPTMTGAAALAATAALRMGAGIVQLAMPGASGSVGPHEAVEHPLPLHGWALDATKDLAPRIRALLVGPGLGRTDIESVLATLAVEVPLVLDGDALVEQIVVHLEPRTEATVLTPHDGEWRRLGGSLDADRLSATRAFAETHGVTVIRKGPTSIVAAPDGRVRVIASGSAALATAGTGDVLAGMTVALLSRGVDAFDAATAAAHIHGRAGSVLGIGLIASDVADAVPSIVREIEAERT